jgi:hypothetical protein
MGDLRVQDGRRQQAQEQQWHCYIDCLGVHLAGHKGKGGLVSVTWAMACVCVQGWSCVACGLRSVLLVLCCIHWNMWVGCPAAA